MAQMPPAKQIGVEHAGYSSVCCAGVKLKLSVTRLTPSGRGAVAVLRLQNAASEVLHPHFSAASGISLSNVPIGRIVYGHWGQEDLVVVRTDALEWEIHCHGGQAAVQQICSDLGVTVISAFADDAESGLLADHLQRRLAACRTRRTADIVLTQTTVLPPYLQTICQMDDEPMREQAILAFLQRSDFARHLRQPCRVAIVGQPNAGKSSLLNALVGYDRAIVYEQPGTTRDLVEAEVVIDGWSFQLVDTAGIRDTADHVELTGVTAAKDSLVTSDACLLVVDATAGWQPADDDILAEVCDSLPLLPVWNKSDLSADSENTVPSASVLKTVSATAENNPVLVSARTGDGLDAIRTWLAALVPPIPDATAPLPIVDVVNDCLTDYLDSKNVTRLRTQLSALCDVITPGGGTSEHR